MDFLIFFLDTFTSGLFYLRPLNSCFEIMWLLVVGGGGMRRLPLQFLGEDSQIKLYMNLNLHHDLVNRLLLFCNQTSQLSMIILLYFVSVVSPLS